MKNKKLTKRILMALVTGGVLFGSVAVPGSVWAATYTDPVVADGVTKDLSGNNAIDVSGANGLEVKNGGKVFNVEGDTLSIKATDNSATTKAIVLDNTAAGDVNLFGVSGLISTGGNQAYGIWVNKGSKATIKGNGEATLAAYATDGKAYAIYASDTNESNNDIFLEGFKEIIGDSTNSFARTVPLYGGTISINGVEKISAYGGKADIDPESSSEAGLAYAVTAAPYADVNLDLNGNNAQITATSKASSAVGISAVVTSYSAVMHVDGIAEITAETNGNEGSHVYANGLDIYGGELYLNRDAGSIGANINVTAPNSYTWGLYVYGGGIIEANINSVTANSVYAYGIQNDSGTMDVNLTGDIKVNGTKDGNAVVARDGTTTITGTGTNSITAHTTTGDAVGVYADGGVTNLNSIGTISATSDGANAYSVYATASGTTVNISGQSAESKTALIGKVDVQDGAVLNLKNVAITGDVVEAKDKTENYGTIKFKGTNTVDGAVTLQGNESVTAAADSYSLTQVGTDATDTITVNGNVSVSGEGSSIAITGKAPTTEGDTKTYYANITGTATAGAGSTLSLTNVEVIGYVQGTGVVNLSGTNTIKAAATGGSDNGGVKSTGDKLTVNIADNSTINSNFMAVGSGNKLRINTTGDVTIHGTEYAEIVNAENGGSVQINEEGAAQKLKIISEQNDNAGLCSYSNADLKVYGLDSLNVTRTKANRGVNAVYASSGSNVTINTVGDQLKTTIAVKGGPMDEDTQHDAAAMALYSTWYTGSGDDKKFATLNAYGIKEVTAETTGLYGQAYAVYETFGSTINLNSATDAIAADSKISAKSDYYAVGVTAAGGEVNIYGIKDINALATGNEAHGVKGIALGLDVYEETDYSSPKSKAYLTINAANSAYKTSISAKSTSSDDLAQPWDAYATGVNSSGEVDADLNGIKDIKAESVRKSYGVYSYSTTSGKTNIIDIDMDGILSASTTGDGGVSNAVYSLYYSDVTIDGNDTAEIKATSSGAGSAAYGVFAYLGANVTLNNILSVTAISSDSVSIYSSGADAVININGKSADSKTTLIGDVIAEDGGVLNLKNVAITGDVAETKDETENYGTIKFKGTNTVDGAVTLNHNQNVSAAADSYSLTQVGTDATDTITVNGNVAVSGEGSSIAITGKVPTTEGETKTYYANITGTATAGAGSTLNLSNVKVKSLTNNGTANLEDVNTTDGWTLAAGSVTNVNSLTNGTDMKAMSKIGTINGTVYAPSGTLDLRGVDLRLKGEPTVFGGTADNPTTLDTLKASRVLFGDIYDGANNLTIKNVVLENCATEYRAALGVYYDSLTVDTVSVNAADGWYWDQQYNLYNYQMYTGFGGTLTINKSLTTGEYINAGYSVGGTGITNLADGAVINCVDFQNTGNMNGTNPVSDEVAAQNIAAGIVHVNGAKATLNAAALNNHAITTLGTVNLTSHSRLTTPSEGVYGVNYGTGAVLTIGTLNFLNKQGDTTKNHMRFGDNAKTIIGGLTTNPDVGADFYVTETSDMTINKDGGNVVKFTGDIVFTTYSNATSDGAKVSMNLDSSDDYFKGAIKGTVSKKARWGKWASGVNGDEVASTEHVKGMTLNMSNGATWTMTGDSVVNNLTVNGSTITKNGDTVYKLNLQDGTSSITNASSVTANVLVNGTGTTLSVVNSGINGTITNNGTLNINNATVADVITKLNGSTTNITGDLTAHSIASQQMGVTNINNGSATGTVDVEATVTGDGSSSWIMFQAVKATGTGSPSGIKGGKMNIGGENFKVNITDSTTGEYVAIYGVHTATNTLDFTQDADQAHTVIDAKNTNINITNSSGNTTTGGVAFTAMSKGILDVDSNLTVKAGTVLATRGDAKTKINVAENKTVKLDGNIEFDYDEATSGTKVDANVDLRLTDSTSYWTGKIVKSSGVGPIPEGKADVSGMNLTLKNAATWTMTGDSFVNNLTMDNNAIVTKKSGDDTHTLTLQGGTSSVTNSTVGADVNVASDAELKVYGNVTGVGELTLNGKLNMQNATAAYNDKLTMTGTFTAISGSKIAFDAQIGAAEAVTSDSIAVGTATGTLAIDTANITVSGDTSAVGSSKVIHLFTDGTATGTNLSGLTITGSAIATSDGYKYDFKQDTTNKGDLVTTKSYGGDLPDIVQNKEVGGYYMGNITTYNLVADYTTPADLGTLTRVSGAATRELTINGNNYELKGDNKKGITVAPGDTLTLKNLKNVSGFDGNVINCGTGGGNPPTHGGTINIIDSTIGGGILLHGETASANVNNSVLNGDVTITFSAAMNITGDTPTVVGDVKTYKSVVNGQIEVSNIHEAADDANYLSLTNTKVTKKISNYGTVEATGALFSSDNGGICNNGGTVTLTSSDFVGNTTEGAIYSNGGTVTVNGTANFSNNTSNSSYGGAVYVANGAKFIIDGKNENVKFENNTVTGNGKGGALSIAQGGQSIDISNVNTLTFSNNKAGQGGAVGIEGSSVNIAATTINYTNNSATSSSASGGAIYNENGTLTMTADIITFSGNTDNDTGTSGEKYGGGALYQRSSSGATATIGKADGTVKFENNKSNTIGGAIGVRATGGKTSAITFNGVTTFSGNTSKLSGGAIWNKGEDDNTVSNIVFNKSVSFTDNKAGVDLQGQPVAQSEAKGGAIWNNVKGNITFNAGSTFSGNTAAGVANDIYNAGTITFAGGENTLAGGITGNGTTTVNSGVGVTLGEVSATTAVDVAQTSIVNKGNLHLGKVNLNANVTDSGTTYVDGDVTVATGKSIANAMTVATGKTLTIDAGGVDGAVTNAGMVALRAGTLEQIITGGSVTTLGDVTTAAGNFVLKGGVINTGNTLTMTGGTLSSMVSSGNVAITGDVTSLGGKLDHNTVTVSSGKSLTLTDGTVEVGDTANTFALNRVYNDDGTIQDPNTSISVTGKLTIDKATLVSATSAQIFNVGIKAMSEADALQYATYKDLDTKSHSQEAQTFVTTNTDVKATAFNSNISNLTFAAGSLQLNDLHYTLEYVNSAKTLLSNVDLGGGKKVTTSLVMMGDLVQYTPQGQVINKVIVDQIDDGSEEEKVTTYDKVTASTINGSLLVGTNEVLSQEKAVEIVEGETSITVRDTSATSLSINQLNLQQKQPTDTFDGVVITNAKSVTVGGSQEAGQTTELMIVTDPQGQQIENPLKVVVGLTKETAKSLNGVDNKVGTLNIGNVNAEASNNYVLNGSIVVNPDSSVKVVGQTNITTDTIKAPDGITLNDAALTVEDGSKIATNGDLKVNNLEANKTSAITGVVEAKNTTVTGSVLNMGAEDVETKIVTDSFILDDSQLNTKDATTANNVAVTAKTVKVKSTSNEVTGSTKKEQSQESTLIGTITATDSVEVIEATDASGTTKSENAKVTLYVGSDNGAAVVSTPLTKLNNNVMLLDPVWKDGVGIEGATNYATNLLNNTMDGTYIVGRNSILTLGSSDNALAPDLFNDTNTQKQLGKEWSATGISAAAYIVDTVNLGTGSLTVDGTITSDSGSSFTVPAAGTLNFAAGSLLMVDTKDKNFTGDEYAISGITSVTVDNKSILFLEGVEKGQTYKILKGDNNTVSADNSNTWKAEQIKTNAITQAVVKFDETNQSYYHVVIEEKDYAFRGTVAPNTLKEMNKADKTTLAYKYVSEVTSAKYAQEVQNANMNRMVDMPEELGVMHDHYTVANMTEDAVAQHLAVDIHKQGKEVWAQAIHSKENVSGLGLEVQGNSYDTQYNGAIVGVDIMDNGKTTIGAALTYVGGKATAAHGSHNEGKYYGATIYGRTKLAENSGLQYDVSYMHSSNDLQLGSGVDTVTPITGDQKVNSISVGARLEQEVKLSNSTSLAPHVGARWLRMKGDSFSNNLGDSYSPDATNTFIVPAGLSFRAGVQSAGWKMSFLADAGYQWNFGNRDYTQNISYNGGYDRYDVAFADRGNWYTAAGFEFARKNFTAEIGYRYLKSSHTRQNRWNVNLSWSF